MKKLSHVPAYDLATGSPFVAVFCVYFVFAAWLNNERGTLTDSPQYHITEGAD